MIDYDPHSWYKLIFNNYTKDIFWRMWSASLMLMAYTAGTVYLMNHYFEIEYQGATTIHSLLGIVLGLFLVFRTNTAYDRWWEGRKQWGALVNVSRNFAVKIKSTFPDDNEQHEFFAKMIPNFVFATKEHLREGVKMEEIQEAKPGFKAEMQKRDHKPLYVMDVIYDRLNEKHREGRIDGYQLLVLDEEGQEFMDIIGACERIKNTPIPFSYNMFIKKFIFLYSITLPYGLMSLLHWWTVPITVIIFYLLVSTELIAEEIEDPFGTDDNDLPTQNLSEKIKANVEEVLLMK